MKTVGVKYCVIITDLKNRQFFYADKKIIPSNDEWTQELLWARLYINKNVARGVANKMSIYHSTEIKSVVVGKVNLIFMGIK